MRNRKLALTFGLLLQGLIALAQTTIPMPGIGPFHSDLELIKYLNLTDAQVALITEATNGYNRLTLDNWDRISELENEIAVEILKDPLDPIALGERYAGIELLHRDSANRLPPLRAQILASLNGNQLGKLGALNDAAELQPLIDEANCENMLGPPTNFFFIPLAGAGVGQGSPGCVGSNVPDDLRQYLSLSTSQSDTITGLNTEYQQQSDRAKQKISLLQGQIVSETAKDPLDPLALGTLYADIETIRRIDKADLATLISKTRAVLNDMQQVTLSSLDAAQNLHYLNYVASCEDLLDPRTSQLFLKSIFAGSMLPTDFFCAPIFSPRVVQPQ